MGEPQSDRERILNLEFQTRRIISDFESEKENRAEKNSLFFQKFDKVDERFQTIESKLWWALGTLGVINALVIWLVTKQQS